MARARLRQLIRMLAWGATGLIMWLMCFAGALLVIPLDEPRPTWTALSAAAFALVGVRMVARRRGAAEAA